MQQEKVFTEAGDLHIMQVPRTQPLSDSSWELEPICWLFDMQMLFQTSRATHFHTMWVDLQGGGATPGSTGREWRVLTLFWRCLLSLVKFTRKWSAVVCICGECGDHQSQPCDLIQDMIIFYPAPYSHQTAAIVTKKLTEYLIRFQPYWFGRLGVVSYVGALLSNVCWITGQQSILLFNSSLSFGHETFDKSEDKADSGLLENFIKRLL